MDRSLQPLPTVAHHHIDAQLQDKAILQGSINQHQRHNHHTIIVIICKIIIFIIIANRGSGSDLCKIKDSQTDTI